MTTRLERPALKRAGTAGKPPQAPSKMEMLTKHLGLIRLIPELPPDQLVPIQAAAAYLNTSMSGITRAIKNGDIVPVIGLGGHRSIRVGDLRRIQEGAVERAQKKAARRSKVAKAALARARSMSAHA